MSVIMNVISYTEFRQSYDWCCETLMSKNGCCCVSVQQLKILNVTIVFNLYHLLNIDNSKVSDAIIKNVKCKMSFILCQALWVMLRCMGVLHCGAMLSCCHAYPCWHLVVCVLLCRGIKLKKEIFPAGTDGRYLKEVNWSQKENMCNLSF